MRIVVDEAIAFWSEAFASVGEVRPIRGSRIGPGDVRDADALIVRTVTRVDRALLEGSSIRFVGTATIGTDHIDIPYLQSQGITHVNAAGCNANAVSEYVTAALHLLAARRGWDLRSRTLGVVGVGHVGSRVVRKAEALGMPVLLCDPPLRDLTGDAKYLELGEVLEADIVTFHVPLTKSGPCPTRHMAGALLFGKLGPSRILINTSRGPVCDGAAMKDALRAGALGGAVLDVWEGEPRLDYELVEKVEIASPHVAGYSMDGKIRATEMMVEALCRFAGLEAAWDSSTFHHATRELSIGSPDAHGAVAESVRKAYDISVDDESVRRLATLPAEQAASAFEKLRTGYSYRPEFHHFRVSLAPGAAGAAPTLRALGFGVAVAGGQSGDQSAS
jgi:erythronate-4-phosphate dehydrogenase